MHYHPEALLVLHKERQDRLEVEAARYALISALREAGEAPKRRRRKWRWRRTRSSRPVPVRLRPLL